MGEATKVPLTLGAPAPDFKNVPAVDGRSYSLHDFDGKKVLVVFFSCNHCPYVQAYEDRLIALQAEFHDQGVQFIAVNSNDGATYPDDSFENMKKRAQEKKFNFLYLHDESQQMAKAYEATHTPHIYVFNAQRKLSYTGKIDDNWRDPAAVTKQFLRNALLALVAGREPDEPQTFAIGCTIKWKR